MIYQTSRKYVSRLPVLAGALVALFCANARAQTLVVGWNFNASTIGQAPAAAAYQSTSGANNSGTLTTNFPTANRVANTGTTVNAVTGDPAGADFTVSGGTTNEGKYIQFQFSTVGFSSLNFSYAAQRSGTGFQTNQLSYSTDGTNFTNVGNAISVPTSYAQRSVSLSTVQAIENNATAYLRLTFTGATGTGGTGRIDNVQITAAPEPTSAALFGAGACGLLMLRRRGTSGKSSTNVLGRFMVNMA